MKISVCYQARKLLEDCCRVLFYRDTRASAHITIGKARGCNACTFGNRWICMVHGMVHGILGVDQFLSHGEYGKGTLVVFSGCVRHQHDRTHSAFESVDHVEGVSHYLCRWMRQEVSSPSRSCSTHIGSTHSSCKGTWEGTGAGDCFHTNNPKPLLSPKPPSNLHSGCKRNGLRETRSSASRRF